MPLEAQGFVLEQPFFLLMCFDAHGFLVAQGLAIPETWDTDGLHIPDALAGMTPPAKLIRLPPASAIMAFFALGFLCITCLRVLTYNFGVGDEAYAWTYCLVSK